MFEPLIEKYIHRSRPAVMATANEARAWAGCILDELRAIRNAIEENNQAYTRFDMPFELAASGTREFTIPANEDWILEAAVMSPYSAASILRIMDAEAAWNPPAVTPIPYFVYRLGSNDTTANPQIRFRAGMHVLIVSDGDGGRYRLWWRKERKTRAQPVPAGQFAASPTFASSPGAADESQRHANAGVFPGVNTIGAARVAHENANGSGQ